MGKPRFDSRKYRSQLSKFEFLNFAARDYPHELLEFTPLNFFILGEEGGIVGDLLYGWSGIAEKPARVEISELLVALDDPGRKPQVLQLIARLYDGLDWLPRLPVRFCHPEELYAENELPFLDGWYGLYEGQIHYYEAFQSLSCMPRLESRCGEAEGSYTTFGDPLVFVKPEEAPLICRDCLKSAPPLLVNIPQRMPAFADAYLDLENEETWEDACRSIQQQADRLRQRGRELGYIHVEFVGADLEISEAERYPERVLDWCREHFPEVEAYAVLI